MADDKRQERELKRQIKKAGQRKLRRYLKDLDATPEDFDYGRKRSDVMNRPRPPRVTERVELPPYSAEDAATSAAPAPAATPSATDEHSTETS